MTIKVKLTTNTSGIVVRPSFSISSNPTTVVTLKNQVLTVSGTSSRLDGLVDVEPAGETDGAIPVYDAETDKYVVERLNLSDVDGPLDGGNF